MLCNVLHGANICRGSTVHISTLLYSWYNAVQMGTILWRLVQYCTVLNNTVQIGTILYSLEKYYIVWYTTVQYYDIQQRSVQYTLLHYGHDIEREGSIGAL